MTEVQEEFFKIASEMYSKKEIELFEKAIDFAKKEFNSEKRISGEEQFLNNIQIGIILMKSKLTSEIVCAGLLYGLDERIIPKILQENFGKDISDLVFGQNQLRVLREKNRNAEAEVVRKILLTSLYDPRVIFVKLASKLTSLLTLDALPESEQRRITKEVFEIYAPLANRFGLEFIKRNLEDEAFKITNPRKFGEIVEFLKASKEERGAFIKSFISEIETLLKNKVKILKIKGREKHIYSIFKKITDRGVPLNKHKDHFAIRIIAENVEDCYKILGIMHENYSPVENTLKDYITSPKLNGYKSIHTVIKTKEEKIVEVQIRTLEMDEFAEEGFAAHWAYKGIKSDVEFERRTAWLRSVLDLQNQADSKEFLKDVKINIFSDEIYCYTPKGKAIELPTGACVLDFAYHIHQEIGDKAIGGRINGIFAPLNKKVNSGDVIEIVTNKNQRPNRDWLKFVVSSKAINKIKNSINRFGNVPAPKRVQLLQQTKENFESIVSSPGFESMTFHLAKCCNPLPPEKIVALMRLAKTFSVHSENCEKVKNLEDKTIPVFWKETFNKSLLIKIIASERSGILADVLNTISRGGFIIKEAKAKILDDGFTECSFEIIPKALDQIIWLIGRVRKVRGVKKIYLE